jgi:allophanate hydrolase subunit 1
MAESLATTPIRYSFGADEHLFAEVSDSMSLEAFFKGMAVTRAVERLALDGVLDVCLAKRRSRSASTRTVSPPMALLEAVRGAEAQAVAERSLQTRIIEIPVLYNDPWTHET